MIAAMAINPPAVQYILVAMPGDHRFDIEIESRNRIPQCRVCTYWTAGCPSFDGECEVIREKVESALKEANDVISECYCRMFSEAARRGTIFSTREKRR